jgi:glycosyltransferase involved in cell wall biosynthesis
MSLKPISGERLRVLHVTSDLSRLTGGPATALLGLAIAQARAGLDVSVLSTWRNDRATEVVAQLQEAGVRVTQVGPARMPLRWHSQIRPTLRRMIPEADVVHLHGLWEEVQHAASRIARRQGTPYVMTPHGMLGDWSLAQSRWRKRIYLAARLRGDLARAAALHFTSDMERDAASIRQRVAPGLRSIVEPLGLDRNEFADLPAPGTFRSQHPRLSGGRIVTFLGRLQHGKGLELLIPAFARVASPDDTLAIVGPAYNAEYTEMVRELVEQHGMADRVLFTGMLTGREKLAALVDSHVMVLPSAHENFGLVVAEALACGCPVILSDQVFCHPLLDGVGVGAVIPLDVDRLATELGRWLNDETLRNDAAARARPFALRTFAWDSIATRWRDHYASMAGHASR